MLEVDAKNLMECQNAVGEGEPARVFLLDENIIN